MDIKNKKTLVIGGAGFIGGHLVNSLLELGAAVTVIDDLSFGNLENINKDAELIQLDIRDFDNIKGFLLKKRPDVVYHLAANATTRESALGWKDPIADCHINTLGTLNVLLASSELETSPMVLLASSNGVYGEAIYTPIDEKHPTNPISPYGISKLINEKYAFAFSHERGLRTTCLRLFNAYGPRQSRYVMYDLMQKLILNPNTLEILGTGEQIRDYTYVSDIVQAFVLATRKEPRCEVFNVSGGNPVSIKELAGMIVKIFNLEDKTELLFSGESWMGDVNKWVADITKIKNELGFEPKVDIYEGLQKLYEWFKTSR